MTNGGARLTFMTASSGTSSSGRRKPRKSLGQHFLRDRSIVKRIVGAARLEGGQDTVIEIGPGRGALTGLLAEAAGRLVLVEYDDALAADLSEKFADQPHVSVVSADARTLSPSDVPEMAEGPYKVVGNLPYYAASPIVRNLLENEAPPTEAVVMVQREVAREMTAKPGEMGLLSVATQLYAEARIVCHAPPRAFSPQPKVHSSVVHLALRAEPSIGGGPTGKFFTLARAGFAAPRKMLPNSLAVGFRGKAAAYAPIIEKAGLDPSQRPATLSMDDWRGLYEAWLEAGEP